MTEQVNVENIFERQKAHKPTMAATSAAERCLKLERLKQSVLANVQLIAQALYDDIGKPITDEPPMEVGKVIHDIDNAIANLAQWMTPIEVAVAGNENAHAYIKSEPLGQVLILAAWNFPFSLALCPLVPALAAGNVAIIKTNEMAPATAKAIENVIADAFSQDEVAVCTGDVNEAIALQALPFDHIFFTGSPTVGKSVMAAAAKNLASVTLELGGKCPAVVDDMPNLENACANIAIGRTFNLGQTCLCVDYAIVKQSQLEQFIEGVKTVLNATYYVDGQYQVERNSRIIDVRNFNRVKGYLDDALEKGASVAFGGACDEANLIVEPTILVNVAPDSKILQEEIFGPVLPVLSYDSVEEIVDIINANPKPLGLYVFSDNEEFIDNIISKTSSGGVSINGWASHYFEVGLPFGGVNNSGIGSYHGEHGFKELSHQKSVYKN